MKKTLKTVLTLILLLLCLAGLFFTLRARARQKDEPLPQATAPAETPEPSPTPEPLAEPVYYSISAVGDCTLCSSQNFTESVHGYKAKMNGDYAYPFSNTVQYFENDDLTIANLECTFSDTKIYSPEMFYFMAPTEWAKILVEGKVDFVTTANNHMLDFGELGLENTYQALEDYGIPYGKEGQAQLITTDSGLKVGIYTDYNDHYPEEADCVAAINELKGQGAEYIIMMFHWGDKELFYSPKDYQVELAHACIDAGADLVYGSHSHCLQPIEKYGDGLILYSMGNWSFGGNTAPSDPDTAIVQVSVKRDSDGSVVNDGFTVIPCCVSGDLEKAAADADNYNDYRPTPYPEGSEGYERVMSKLSGTFKPDSEGADYSNYWQSWG